MSPIIAANSFKSWTKEPHPDEHNCAVCGATDTCAAPHAANLVILHAAREQHSMGGERQMIPGYSGIKKKINKNLCKKRGEQHMSLKTAALLLYRFSN